MVGPHGHERGQLADRGTPDPTDQHVRISRELGQIGRDMRRRDLGNHTQPLVADTRHPRNRATPIATKQIARPHRVLGAGIVVFDPRADAVAILLQPDQLAVKADLPGSSSSARAFMIGSRRICGRLALRQGLACIQLRFS